MTQNVIWADVDGYENLYQVSNTGMVRSLDRTISHSKTNKMKLKGITLSPSNDGNGYLHVALHRYKEIKTFKVHRLVAKAFILNPDNKKTVNHKDSNRKNNNVLNLEWASYRENITHKTRKNNKLTGASPRGKKWMSTIFINGKQEWLGTYETPLEAHEVYLKRLKEYRLSQSLI